MSPVDPREIHATLEKLRSQHDKYVPLRTVFRLAEVCPGVRILVVPSLTQFQANMMIPEAIRSATTWQYAVTIRRWGELRLEDRAQAASSITIADPSISIEGMHFDVAVHPRGPSISMWGRWWDETVLPKMTEARIFETFGLGSG